MNTIEREFWAGIFAGAVLVVMILLAIYNAIAWLLRLPMRIWHEARKQCD